MTDPAALPATPPAGDPPVDPQTPPAAGEPPKAPKTPEITPEMQALIDAAVAAERKEAAKYRTELKKLQDAKQVADDAQLSEAERLQKRVAELEAANTAALNQAKEQLLRMATVSAAAKLGYADPEDAHRLLDVDQVEYSEDGRPKNVEKLLGDLIKAKPYLAATGRTAGDWVGGQRGKSTLTRKDIEAMTPTEINARWPEVQEAMARGL